jgi:hypothetical protein
MHSLLRDFIPSQRQNRAHIVISIIILILITPFNVFSKDKHKPVKREKFSQQAASSIDSISDLIKEIPDSITFTDQQIELGAGAVATINDSITTISNDSIKFVATDSILKPKSKFGYDQWEEREVDFNPDPTRAVWLSALFPGLGQIYNRRYWKLPLVVGGYLGLAYATSWNNNMLNDYTKAYRDIMDSDPTTNSYMDFFPSTTKEEDLDTSWLTSTLKSRKDYFRRNRDLCIICMVGVYFLAMVDAYVDASLSHFDISPNLSMDVSPAIIPDGRNKYPSVGLQWAINF